MDFNFTKTLEKIGLNEKQAAVYAACLALGEASMTEIAKQSEFKRPTVYLIVDELLGMGLLSETQKGKRNIYAAVHPRRLLEIAEFRAQRMKEQLPELVALYNTPKTKPKIQVFESETGVRAVYQQILGIMHEADEMLFVSNVSAIFKRVPDLFEEFVERMFALKKLRIRELDYDDETAREWQKRLRASNRKHHEARLLSADHPLGDMDCIIFHSHVYFFSLAADIFVVAIESEHVASLMRALFEAAWMVGKEA